MKQKDIENLFEGRIGRQDYFMGVIFLCVVPWFAWILVHGGIVGVVVNACVTLASAVLGLSLTARRVHDFDITGWATLLMCVPMLNFALFVVFALVPGSSGKNLYGVTSKERSFFDMLFNK